MTLRDEQKEVQRAMNNALSGLREDPWLAQRVLANAKGEEPMAKKLSAATILVIVLILLSVTAALAAGLGLFGELSRDGESDGRLSALEETAEPISVSLTTPDDVTVEIGQAYYEGNRVFISYRLTGNVISVEMHEGAPDEGIRWQDVLTDFIAADKWRNDLPELQRLNEWLDGRGQRWGSAFFAELHDGLFLEDGTYLDIIGGDSRVQEDGSIVGWKECEIPEAYIADELTFKAVLFRVRVMDYQDHATLKRVSERGENTDIFFTLRRNDRYICLNGAASNDTYQARVELASGKIDMKGAVRLTAPEKWISAWEYGNDESPDVIMDWILYQNGQAVSRTGTQSVRTEGADKLYFELLYPCLRDFDGLSLIPEYSQSGEHADEAIRIERIIP